MGLMGVLAIDDEPSIRSLVQRCLPSDRYAVTVAGDGEEGLSLFRQHGFDVVIVDLQLPKCDGLEVVRRIKRDCPTCITIMMTGHGTLEVAQQLMREGCDDLLLKPVPDLSIVDHTIQRCLERRRLVCGIESLAQLGDAHQTLLGLVARSSRTLLDRCTQLVARLREADAFAIRPELEAPCEELRDGLRSLEGLLRQNAWPVSEGLLGLDGAGTVSEASHE